MKQAFGGLFRRKEKKVKLVDADADSDNEFHDKLQDVAEAKAQYEELQRAASHAAKQAQGFARSQQELAACFSETFGSSDDMDIADCFKRLGRVQGEIAKLLDQYSGQLHQMVVLPTEELQQELDRMDNTRKTWDDKRQACEAMKARAARGKRRTSWGQNGEEPMEDLASLQAQDEYDDAHMALGQQLMAIEHRRPKVLIQQAARLHGAQMTLFTRALQNVHAIEPYVKELSVQHNVDRRLPNGDGYSDDDHEDEDRSNADSVEHAPPSVWDEFDSQASSPTGHREIKDLPPESAAEWSPLLHILNETLQDMGEQTLDQRDAVFVVNALLMASTEQGKQHHMYQRSQSGPLSLNTHSGSRSAPLSSTGVPLHLLQAVGGAAAGPKTPPLEEAPPPRREEATQRRPSLQVQVAGRGEPVSKSGPLTPTGGLIGAGAQSSQGAVPSSSTTPRTPAPVTRSSGSRGSSSSSSYRAAKSGPVFPISAPGGSFQQTRHVLSANARTTGHYMASQGTPISLADLAKAAGGPTIVHSQSSKSRNSSVYASKSGPIIMSTPRGLSTAPSRSDSLGSDSIPYSLPTEASQGPPRIGTEPIVPKSGPIGRSPLAKSSVSPNGSPPLSPPRNSSPSLLYQLPAPPVQVGSAPMAGNHFLGGAPLMRSAEPILPNSSGISGNGTEGDVPSLLPPPPAAGGKLLMRRNSRDRSEPAINGGNGLIISIPHNQHLVHAKSARARVMPNPPLSPITPSEDGTATPSPAARVPMSVGPHYANQTVNHSGPEENQLRRSMSFEIVKPGSKGLPLDPTNADPPRRSPPVAQMSPERPLVTISSPLPAMPPSTPPDRPESQGALNALAGEEREELIKAVNSENFRWKYIEDPPYKGPKQVPELETLGPEQKQRLFQTLARAVKSRREAFIDGNTHGFSDLPPDLAQETH